MSTPLIEDIVQLTCDLIQYESIEHRPSEIAAVMDYTEQYARQIAGVSIERVESAGVPNLVVALGSGRNPKLILNAHLDVVPARPEQFKPVVRDGRIYGRGSQDMKGSAAVLLRLLKDLAALPQAPDV